MKFSRPFILWTLYYLLCITSCSDGDNGTNGVNGVDGIDGINSTDGKHGTNGQDGTNAVGYDELAKYGHVSLQLEGIRADGWCAVQGLHYIQVSVCESFTLAFIQPTVPSCEQCTYAPHRAQT